MVKLSEKIKGIAIVGLYTLTLGVAGITTSIPDNVISVKKETPSISDIYLVDRNRDGEYDQVVTHIPGTRIPITIYSEPREDQKSYYRDHKS